MRKVKINLTWLIIITLLIISSYQTYALASISSQLNESGVSFGGKTKTSYNFSANNNSLGELPDMAGGC